MKQVFVLSRSRSRLGSRRARRSSPSIANVCGNGLLEAGEDCDSGDATLRALRGCLHGGDATARRPTTRAASTVCATRRAARCRGRAPSVVRGRTTTRDRHRSRWHRRRDRRVAHVDRRALRRRRRPAVARRVVRDAVADGPGGVRRSRQRRHARRDGRDPRRARLVHVDVRQPVAARQSRPISSVRRRAAGHEAHLHDRAADLGAFVDDRTATSRTSSPTSSTRRIRWAVPPCGQVIPIAGFSPDNVDIHQTSRTTATATHYVVSLDHRHRRDEAAVRDGDPKENILAAPQIYDITPPTPPMMAHVPMPRGPHQRSRSVPEPHQCRRRTDGASQVGRRDAGHRAPTAHCVFKATPRWGDVMRRWRASPGDVHRSRAAGTGRVQHRRRCARALRRRVHLRAGSDGQVPRGVSLDATARARRRRRHQCAMASTTSRSAPMARTTSTSCIASTTRSSDASDALYELRRIDTAGAVSTISIDDFDGNGKIDVAYTEPVAGHQRLMILYTTGRPADTGGRGRCLSGGELDRAHRVRRLERRCSRSPRTCSCCSRERRPRRRCSTAARSARCSRTSIRGRRRAPTRFATRRSSAATAIGQFAPTSGTDYPDIVGLAPPRWRRPATPRVRAWSVPVTRRWARWHAERRPRRQQCRRLLERPGRRQPVHRGCEVPRVARGRRSRRRVRRRQRADPARRGVRSAQRASGTLHRDAGDALPIPADTAIRSLHSGDVDGDGAAEPDRDVRTRLESPDGQRGARLPDERSGCRRVRGPRAEGHRGRAGDGRMPRCRARPARLSRSVDHTVVGLDLLVLCRDTGSTLYRVTKTADDYTVTALTHVAARSVRSRSATSPATVSTTWSASRARPEGGRSWCFRSARRATPRPAHARGRNNDDDHANARSRSRSCLALGAGTARAERTRTAERYFRAGAKAYSAQNFSAAATNFDEAFKALPMPEIAFSAAQAYRRLYQIEPKPEYVRRSIELYQRYLADVKTGGRVGDAADNLADMKRELAKLEAAGVSTTRRDRRRSTRGSASTSASPTRRRPSSARCARSGRARARR